MRLSKTKKHESEQTLFNKFRNKFFIKKEKEIDPNNKKGSTLIIKIIDPFILWIFKKRVMLLNPYRVIYGHYFYDGIIHYKDILFKNNKIIDKESNIRQISEKELYKNASNQVISHFNFEVINNLIEKLNEAYREEHPDMSDVDLNYTYNEDNAEVDIFEPIETKFDDNKKILEIL